MNFSKYAERVVILVRGDSLSSTMSQYLIDQIKETPNIQLWTHASVAEVHGDTRLEEISVLCSDTNKMERVPASSMFIFIGALPRTDWLGDTVERDERGFILTGPDLMQGGAASERMDAGSRSISAGNKCARHICGRRCAPRFREASRLGSWRGVGRGPVHPSVFEQGINGRNLRTAKPRPCIPGNTRRSDCLVPQQRKNCISSRVKAYAREGDPADAMFVLLEESSNGAGRLAAKASFSRSRPAKLPEFCLFPE